MPPHPVKAEHCTLAQSSVQGPLSHPHNEHSFFRSLDGASLDGPSRTYKGQARTRTQLAVSCVLLRSSTKYEVSSHIF